MNCSRPDVRADSDPIAHPTEITHATDLPNGTPGDDPNEDTIGKNPDQSPNGPAAEEEEEQDTLQDPGGPRDNPGDNGNDALLASALDQSPGSRRHTALKPMQ